MDHRRLVGTVLKLSHTSSLRCASRLPRLCRCA
jgi:hypothetical protein